MRRSPLALLLLLIFFCSISIGNAAIYPKNGASWLVVGSRDNANTAIDYAKKLSRQHKKVHVFKSNNGWFAISLGWARKAKGAVIRRSLVSSRSIPGDSYFHSGERFLKLIWSSSGRIPSSRNALLAVTQLGGSPANNNPPKQISTHANGPAYVTGLSTSSDSYLSLRNGPSRSRREIGRLKLHTNLSILGTLDGWHQVQVSDGRSGWVYGRYVTSGYPPAPVVKPKEPEIIVQEPTPEPEPQIFVDETENGAKVKVAGLTEKGYDYIALRKGPSDTYLVVARLQEKTKLVVTGKSGEWYRVRPAPSVEGWIQAEYVIAADIPTFGPEEEKAPEPKVPEITTPSPDTDDKMPKELGRRIALVLGNSAYEHTVELTNPKNDAKSISAKLTGLGFEVIVGLDGTKSGMESSIRDFVRLLPGSDVALFFYAGHAMQISGVNYLIPIDAKLEDSTAIDFETIKLSSILDFIDEPGRISIALLDACRDNPLSRRFVRSVSATRSAGLSRGLASPISAGNLLIGFATAPGEVALDGDGANSPFTTALLKHIDTPKTEVESMLKRVRAEVFEQTKEQQSPWVNSALRKDFYFNPQ